MATKTGIFYGYKLIPYLLRFSDFFTMTTRDFASFGFLPLSLSFWIKSKIVSAQRTIPWPFVYPKGDPKNTLTYNENVVKETLCRPAVKFTKDHLFDVNENIIDHLKDIQDYVKLQWPGIVEETVRTRLAKNREKGLQAINHYIAVGELTLIEVSTEDIYTFVLGKTMSGTPYYRHLIFTKVVDDKHKETHTADDLSEDEMQRRLGALCGDRCRMGSVIIPKKSVVCRADGTSALIKPAKQRWLSEQALKKFKLFDPQGNSIK